MRLPFAWYVAIRALHSFPTRRSSDLIVQGNPSSGIFALSLDKNEKVIALGGDYKEPSYSERIAAYSLDNGKTRSEEHTSELQSHSDLVCRLLLEKKNAGALPRGPARH